MVFNSKFYVAILLIITIKVFGKVIPEEYEKYPECDGVDREGVVHFEKKDNKINNFPEKMCVKKKRITEKEKEIVETKIFSAVRNSDLTLLSQLINDDANVNVKNKKGETPLIVGGYYHNEDIIEMLLKAGATINAQSNKGDTALMNAAYKGHQNIVKLLLNNDANTDITTYKYEYTALRYAIAQKKKNIVDLFLRRGLTNKVEIAQHEKDLEKKEERIRETWKKIEEAEKIIALMDKKDFRKFLIVKIDTIKELLDSEENEEERKRLIIFLNENEAKLEEIN